MSMENLNQSIRAFSIRSQTSLFPAYEETPAEQTAPIQSEEYTQPPSGTLWLENCSFNDEDVRLARADTTSVVPEFLSGGSSESSSDTDNYTPGVRFIELDGRKCAVAVTNEKRKKTDTRVREKQEELFYQDLSGSSQYKNVRTLHIPACPIYDKPHVSCTLVPAGSEYIKLAQLKSKAGWKRYYRRSDLIKQASQYHIIKPLSNGNFSHKLAVLNQKTQKSPREIKNWIELIELQDRNPYKWSSMYITEKKMEYLKKSMEELPSNPQLYKIYLDVLTANYPVSDQPKMLQALLAKDVYSYELWSANVMITQAVMSRTNVPSVLSLYRHFMRTFVKRGMSSNKELDRNVTDNVVIQIFHKCALFLRQSGRMEHFITLVKFMMEFNTIERAKAYDSLADKPGDDARLMDCEEVILKSGLPINEIWLRIEKLRQGFHFLPFTVPGQYCSDAQRIVYRGDIFDFIYQLNNPDNTFKLLLIILKLMKLPFVRTETLANRIEINKNSEAAEDLLPVLLQPIHLLSSERRKEFYQFEESVYELVEDTVISPTYLATTISCSIYERCIQDLLISLSSAFSHKDKRSLVFLTLWCRFQRLILALHKYAKKDITETIKTIQSRFRSIVKQPHNRNNILLYVEYALFENQADTSKEVVKNVLQTIIEKSNSDRCDESNLSYVYVTYAELLFSWNEVDAACQVLCSLALKEKLQSLQILNKSRQLAALKILRDKLDRAVYIEQHVNVMMLEQHFLPDHFILTIKAYTLLLCILQQKKDAVTYLNKLLGIFQKNVNNERHSYIREMILEYYMLILQLEDTKCVYLRSKIKEHIKNAVLEYPRNFLLLQLWSITSSALWYQVRSVYLKLSSNCICVMMLLATARFRFMKVVKDQSEAFKHNNDCVGLMAHDIGYQAKVFNQRIESILKYVLSRENVSREIRDSQEFGFEIYRNDLLWRCYLRCLGERVISSDIRKKYLLSALDACPWHKAVYLEGALFMPEMSNDIQDLIIEKRMRMHAIAAELVVLSDGDTEML